MKPVPMLPVLATALLLAGTATAQTTIVIAKGNVASGAEIARTWCRNCHVIDSSATQASDAVPSFPAVARRPGTTVDGLRTFLTVPHRMPNFQLTPQQIDDVSAYILSLKPTP